MWATPLKSVLLKSRPEKEMLSRDGFQICSVVEFLLHGCGEKGVKEAIFIGICIRAAIIFIRREINDTLRPTYY